MIDYEKIGRRIYEERKFLHHISQEKMAEDLGMYQPDISNLEKARKGSGITDLSKLELIADYFDLPIENLLFGTSMEAHMVDYYGSKMEIRPYKGKKAVKSKEHGKILTKLIGRDPEETHPWCYECGPYTLYVGMETQHRIERAEQLTEEGPIDTKKNVKIHIYVFFNDSIIANLLASTFPVFNVVNWNAVRSLKEMIPPDVLDPTDVWRTLNPYGPLMIFAETEEEQAEYEELVPKRMDALRPIWNRAVVMIESIYVQEDCRRHGVCRMMLDLVKKIGQDPIIWLNLEPTSGTELDSEYDYFPEYTLADVGQISMNAAIAERLGFTIDPDTWHRKTEVADPDGSTHIETVLVRKCAYYLPAYAREIIKNDGNLVALGRARQKMVQEAEGEVDPQKGIVDIFHGGTNGDQIMAIRKVDDNGILYIFGYLPAGKKIWYGVSSNNPVKAGQNIECLEKYESYEDTRNSEYHGWFDVIMAFLEMTAIQSEMEEKKDNE